MSNSSLGIEGCASWAPESTRRSFLTSRSGQRRPLTALEHYQMNASRPLTRDSPLGPPIFAQARRSNDSRDLPPLSPEPGEVASRVTPSFVHERDETERFGAGAPIAGGVPGSVAGPPALTTSLGPATSAAPLLASGPRTLNYLCDPHRLGTHQRQKGYVSPTPRSSGPSVQYNSMYGLPVRYTGGNMFSGTDRLMGQAGRGGIESFGSSSGMSSGRTSTSGVATELTGRSLQQDSYRPSASQTNLRPMARSKSTEPPRLSARATSQSWLFNPHTKKSMETEAPILQSHFMLG